MKWLSPAAMSMLGRLQSRLQGLWEVSQGRDAEGLDFSWLRREALGTLIGMKPGVRALFEAETKAAVLAGDRVRLAGLILKMIALDVGLRAVEESIASADQSLTVVGQKRARRLDVQLADALNQPGFEGLTKRECARRLERQGFGKAETIERRVRRMIKRGFSMSGRRLSATGHTRKKK